MIKNKKIARSKLLVLLVFLTAIVAGVLFFYFIINASSPKKISSVNYGGPTKEERLAADTQKARNIQREKQNVQASSKEVGVVIVDANQYGKFIEVRSYVTGVFEDGGVCKATFKKDETLSFSVSSGGIASASYTTCKTILVPIERFSTGGVWKVNVYYESSSASGLSEFLDIKVGQYE